MKTIEAKTWKTIAIAVLVVLVFIGLFYFLSNKSANLITGNPNDVAESFIEEWHIQGTLEDKILADKISATSDILTRDFALSLGEVESGLETNSIDPATCLFKTEGKVKMTRREIDREEGVATVYATQEIEGGENRDIAIEMIASAGAWRINKITCL